MFNKQKLQHKFLTTLIAIPTNRIKLISLTYCFPTFLFPHLFIKMSNNLYKKIVYQILIALVLTYFGSKKSYL